MHNWQYGRLTSRSEVLVQKLVVESLTVITLILRLVGVVVMVDVTNVTGFVVLQPRAKQALIPIF
jgi:hypothetical protein